MHRRFSPARSLAPLVLGLCVWLLWPAQAFAAALIRFIHAVPGVGTATVDVDAGGVNQQVVEVFRAVRILVAIGHLLASDAKRRPRHCR